MKKFGFTLAEVLITLSIIGVVAAISLPGLVKASRKDIYNSKMAVSVQNIEEALSNALVVEVKQDLTDTTLFSSGYCQSFINNLSKYLIFSGTGDCTNDTSDTAFTLNLRNGTVANINLTALPNSHANTVATIAIDVNGSKGPGSDGRDQYSFNLGSNGILSRVEGGLSSNSQSSSSD